MTNNVSRRDRWELLLYFLKLGSVRYGGPITLVESMHRDLVAEGRRFTEDDYRVGLALSQIAPGPLATQLATYFGWLTGGFWMAVGATIAFILPSFLMVLVLAAIYTHNSNSEWLNNISYGIAPVVIALVVKSGSRLFLETDLRSVPNKIVFLLSFLVTVIYKQEVAWVFIAAAFLPSLLNLKFKTLAISVPLFSVSWERLGEIFMYFVEVGAFVFGSGLVIVPFLYGGLVVEHQWLTEKQFLDSMAVGMMTPGPIVITVAFIGYLLGGLPGATASALGIFLPCFLFVVIPAPIFRKVLAKHPEIYKSVDSIAVAALGAIFGGAALLIHSNLTTMSQQILAVGFLVGMLIFKKIPDPLWVLLGVIISMSKASAAGL